LTLCLLSSLTDKSKAYISQSSALGGEDTGQDKKQREKEDDADEERKIISCPLTWF